MSEAILLVVSKIGAFVLNEEIPAVIKKLSRNVTDLEKFPAKIKIIGNELKAMNDIIQDLGTTVLSNNVIKDWIGYVRNLALHVEDVMDKYSYEALKLKEEGFLHRYACRGSRHIMVFSKIAYQVEEIEKEIEHIKHQQDYWIDTVQPIENEQFGGCFRELVLYEDLVGIDENRSKLTEWLATDEKESTVISVYGMGGLGKTTLVNYVYDREKANFPDAHAWIAVSQAYNVTNLLEKLLTKIQHVQQSPLAVGAAVGDQADVHELTWAIKKILQDRKCLIVLDDVWDKEAYTQMCSAFEGIQGSRVIITTRKEDVAAIAPQERRLRLQPLGCAESFKLFCSRAFYNSPDRKCPLELETVATAIVDRCHGLPLAIICSGNLFCTKHPTEHAWNQVYRRLRSELQGIDNFQAILSWSYHDLPGDLKNCFLYCTLFPEGYPMPRESLVRLWVAEGFAMKRDDSTPEEVAEENLMELIGRNMLEVVEIDELLRVSTCKMHDIIRDLALAVAKKERFASASDHREVMHMDREVRRFSLCDWGDSNKKTPAGVEFPLLRTVVSIASPSNMLPSVFSGSRYLTVLELEDSLIKQVPESIGNLFNLRYIGLRRTQVQSLPDTIDKLFNLETLDLKHSRIEKLPPGIVKMQKLRHLFADWYVDEKQTVFRYSVGVEAPKMISNFQELQTLETVHASKDLALQLKKMEKLQTVCIDNIDASNCEELFCTLSDMPLLSSLLLSASDEKEALSFHNLGSLCDRLHRLIVRGGTCSTDLPMFRDHGRNLKYLSLSWCNIGTENPLQLLASHMPNLTYLSLNRVRSDGILVISPECFPQLKTLVLKRMPKVKQLVIGWHAMPCIDAIYITTLLGLNAVPRGIGFLRSLRKLWMLDLHRDFKADWIQNQMDYKMEHVTDLRV